MAEKIELAKAYVQIIPSTEGIKGSLESALGGEAESAGKSAGSKFGGAMGGALKAGLGISAAAFTTTVAGVSALSSAIITGSKETAAYGDQVDKMSQKLGLSAESYQTWDYVLSQSGADINSMSTGLKTLTNKIDDARNGSADAAAMFEQLGISTEQLQTMSREDLFEQAIFGFQKMEDSVERAALANDLFGKSGQELTPLFNTTNDETQKLMQNAKDLGMVMSDNAVKNAAAFTDSMDNLSRAFTGAKNNIMSQFLPGLTDVTNGLANLIAGNDGAKESIVSGFQSIGSAVIEAIPVITESLGTIIEALAEIAPEIIISLGKGIIEQLPNLIPIAFEVIQELTMALIDNLPLIIETGLQCIIQLALGIAEALPELIPTIVEVVLTIVEVLIDNIDLLVDAAIQLTIGIAEGLIKALPILIEKAPVLIEKLVSALIENIPKLIECAGKLIVSLVKGLIENLPQLVKAAGQIVGSLVSGIINLGAKIWEAGKNVIGQFGDAIKDFGSNALEWGKDLIRNFIDGIFSLADNVRDAVGNIAQIVKDYLGFSEPDKGPLSNFHTFAPDMINLFASGIDQNMNIVTESAERMASEVEDAIQGSIDSASLDVRANVSSDRMNTRSYQSDSGRNNNATISGTTINVYASPGQDERKIAEKVANILNNQVISAQAVFA